MDVSSFLSGNFLTHLDLPLPLQVWTIQSAAPQLVGTDQKICISFAEFPAKPLGCNKTNLTRIAELYGTNADGWIGKQMQVYRSTTSYSGKVMQCIRLAGPGQATPDPVCDAQGNLIPPAAPAAPMAVQQPVAVLAMGTPVAVQQAVAPVQVQPVAAPQQPVAAPAQTPWEQDLANQQNSPPNA
jgi:hypothetical protein